MVVLLALLGALLFALAAAAEQRAASRVLRPPSSARCASGACAARWQQLSRARRLKHQARRGLRAAASLLRSPLWIAGWAADALGFVTQAGAVHFGSLSVVQPLLVTTLLFSLPLAALGGRRRPRWADWAAASAACAGLALILSGRRTAATAEVHQARLIGMALLVVALTVALVLVAQARPGGRAVPLAIAAGMMFALGAAFTKLVGDSLATRGVSGTAAYWPSYALIVVALSGLVLQQVAFTAGSLPATMTAITITDPLLSYALGVGGFGEHAPHGAVPITLALAGLGLLGAGVAVLARSPLLHRPAPEPAAGLPAAAPAAPSAAPAHSAGPVVPGEPAPAIPARHVPAAPAERGTAIPARHVPAAPAERGTAIPARHVPAAPAERATVIPARHVPAAPRERVAALPAERSRAVRSEQGAVFSPEQVPTVSVSAWVLAGLSLGSIAPAAALQLHTSRNERKRAAGPPPRSNV